MSTTSEYTLERWIQKFRSELNTITAFSMKTAMSDGESMTVFSEESILSKYHKELETHKIYSDLTQREQEFYAYNPRLFSYDLYGEPEYWYLILYANELTSALDFHLKRVKFYQPTVMTLLDSIRVLETKHKDQNEQDMTDIRVNRTSINNDFK